MLKKCPIFLCLILIFSANIISMERQNNNLNSEDVELLKNYVLDHIWIDGEGFIIDFLKSKEPEEQQFIADYLPFIFKAINRANFKEALKYIQANCMKKTVDKIRCALKVNDLKTVQELTHYTNFITGSGRFKISAYQEQLQRWNLGPVFLDRILCRMGVNWKDYYSRERYLNILLKKEHLDNKYKKLILRFLSKLHSIAINTKDEKTGNTALHEALYAYDKHKELKDSEGMDIMAAVIEILIKKGAKQSIPNKHNIMPNDFIYFEDNKELITTWKVEDQKMLTIQAIQDQNPKQAMATNTSKRKAKNSQVSPLVMTAISAIGFAAICCLSYKLLNSNKTSTTIRLK